MVDSWDDPHPMVIGVIEDENSEDDGDAMYMAVFEGRRLPSPVTASMLPPSPALHWKATRGFLLTVGPCLGTYVEEGQYMVGLRTVEHVARWSPMVLHRTWYNPAAYGDMVEDNCGLPFEVPENHGIDVPEGVLLCRDATGIRNEWNIVLLGAVEGVDRSDWATLADWDDLHRHLMAKSRPVPWQPRASVSLNGDVAKGPQFRSLHWSLAAADSYPSDICRGEPLQEKTLPEKNPEPVRNFETAPPFRLPRPDLAPRWLVNTGPLGFEEPPLTPLDAIAEHTQRPVDTDREEPLRPALSVLAAYLALKMLRRAFASAAGWNDFLHYLQVRARSGSIHRLEMMTIDIVDPGLQEAITYYNAAPPAFPGYDPMERSLRVLNEHFERVFQQPSSIVSSREAEWSDLVRHTRECVIRGDEHPARHLIEEHLLRAADLYAQLVTAVNNEPRGPVQLLARPPARIASFRAVRAAERSRQAARTRELELAMFGEPQSQGRYARRRGRR